MADYSSRLLAVCYGLENDSHIQSTVQVQFMEIFADEFMRDQVERALEGPGTLGELICWVQMAEQRR